MLKRAVDVVVSAAALVLAAPVMAVVALVVRARMGSPVLFRQARPGHGARQFTIYKFRTMTDERDPVSGDLKPDADRLTPTGRRLRAWSLDELPSLWNVLRGDMSLVGPRPLLVQYLDRYSPEQARRHDVRPGVTGPAQVSGRNALTWDERLALDVWYVDNRSLWLDLRMIVATVGVVARRIGINRPGHATSPEFGGEGGPA